MSSHAESAQARTEVPLGEKGPTSDVSSPSGSASSGPSRDDVLAGRVSTEESIEYYLQTYRDLVGFVPPRVQSRFDQLGETNPELLVSQEKVRNLITYTDALDQKTVQLVLFAILSVQLRDAARIHGAAAKRAGVTEDELQAVLDLAYLFGGTSVTNHGPAILEGVRKLEAKAEAIASGDE
jgi:4-carboxymuconolactone decarboxylase